jgi:hypothetical protein
MGKCLQCANPPEPGRKLCRAHLDYYKRAAQKWRNKQRAAGLCVACGQGPLVTKSYCARCQARMKAKRKKRVPTCTLCVISGHHRRDHKKLGLCGLCPKKAKKRGFCPEHLEEARERYREQARHLRQERAKQKVCQRCGAASFGKTLCPKHLAYMREWQKNHRRESGV